MKKFFIFSSILFILSSAMMIFTMFSNNDTSYQGKNTASGEYSSISEVEDEYNFDIEKASSVVAEDVYDSDIKEYHKQLRVEQEASQSSYDDEDVFTFGQYEEREGKPNPVYTDGTLETATGNEERYQDEPEQYDEVFKTKADREAAEDALANLFIDTFKRKMEWEYYKMIYD